MTDPTRRRWLRDVSALAVAGLRDVLPGGGRSAPAAPPPSRAGCSLSIGTYSLKGMGLEEAIEAVARIGFDAIELATQPGFQAEPGSLSNDRRAEVRRRLGASGLPVSALMEDLHPSPEARQHRADLDRLGRVLALANDLAPGHPPLLQTVLGGGKWDEVRGLFRDRVGDWLAAATKAGVVLAIKPHRGGALSRPDEAIWLIQQLGDSRHLRMVFDYSHYAFRDMPLEETTRAALPYIGHVAVKDAVRRGSGVAFTLPGEGGSFDYAPFLRLLRDGGYRGDICCEVSSIVWRVPGYDPVAAATTCYRNMARAFARADVPRNRR